MAERTRTLIVVAAVFVLAGVLSTGCGQPAPSASPTKAPAVAPTSAPAAVPTAAPAAAPTKAPAAAPTTPPATAVPKVTYPEKGKNLTMIVPWNAGGATDVGARVIAPSMEKELGVQIQIVNKPGASSQVGITELAKAKPDGYTVGWTNLPNSMSPYLDPSRQCAYSRKDLVQVANIALDPNVFTVNSGSQYKTLKDLLDDVKARPDRVKIAIGGIGGPDHVAMLLFQEMTGLKFQLVNFAEGGATHVTALLAGDVDVSAVNLGAFAAQVKGGAVRFLAIMDDQRSPFPALKDVPTFKELGYNISYASSRGICVPAGTPKEAVNALSSSVKKAMDDPEVKKKHDEVLLALRYMNADEYTRYWDDFEKQMKPVLDKILIEQKK